MSVDYSFYTQCLLGNAACFQVCDSNLIQPEWQQTVLAFVIGRWENKTWLIGEITGAV